MNKITFIYTQIGDFLIQQIRFYDFLLLTYDCFAHKDVESEILSLNSTELTEALIF